MIHRSARNEVLKIGGKGTWSVLSSQDGIAAQDAKRNKALTGVSLLRESIWFGRSVLATDGGFVGCLVGIRGGRCFASASNGF
jgi:hypothetical protein